jgi:hypothetical protein
MVNDRTEDDVEKIVTMAMHLFQGPLQDQKKLQKTIQRHNRINFLKGYTV